MPRGSDPYMDASLSSELLQYGDEIALEYLRTEEERVTGVHGFVVGTPEISNSVSVRFSRGSTIPNQSQARFVVYTACQYEAAMQLQQADNASLQTSISGTASSAASMPSSSPRRRALPFCAFAKSVS